MFKKLKILFMLPDYIKSKDTIVNKQSQIYWGRSLAKKVCLGSSLQRTPTGSVLYYKFQPEFKAFMVDEKWDPYKTQMTYKQLRKWLWNHVIFDGVGQIIGLHDRGVLLYYKETWDEEVGLFCKIWM